MKKKIIKLLCVSLTACLLAGCSLIDILKDSASPKTNILLEIAEVYQDYIIAYPMGNTIGSIPSSEPMIISHSQTGALVSESYGLVPDHAVYPPIDGEPMTGGIYGINGNYVDVSNLSDFDNYYLNRGDQLLIYFGENGLNSMDNTVVAVSVEVIYAKDVPYEEISLYTLIGKLNEFGRVTLTNTSNDSWSFKGRQFGLSIRYNDGTFASMIIYQYATNKEMEGDASNMSEDGKYSGQAFANKEYHFKIGRLIASISASSSLSDYNLNKTLDVFTEIAGEPFAQNYPETYKSLEDERDQY